MLYNSSAAIPSICESGFHLGIVAFALRQQMEMAQRKSNTAAAATGMMINSIVLRLLLFPKPRNDK